MTDSHFLFLFFASWLVGAGAVLLLYWRLQHALDERAIAAYDMAPVAHSRRFMWNASLVLVIYSFCYAVMGALALPTIVLALFAVWALDMALLSYFGRVLEAADLASWREAGKIAPEYLRTKKLRASAVVSGGAFVLLVLVALYVNHRIEFSDRFDQYQAALMAMCLTALVWLRVTGRDWPLTSDEMAVSQTDQNINARRLGFVLQALLLLARNSTPSKPAEFAASLGKLQAMTGSASRSQLADDATPDIIFLMMESFCDLERIGVPLAKDPLASLKYEFPNLLRGELKVSVLGGNTCNTEFEILTGIPADSTGVCPTPYMGKLNDGIYSLPIALSQRGYVARAVHPFHRWFYNRDTVYKKLGFESFVADEAFSTSERRYDRVSDRAFVSKVFEQLNDDSPSFVFGVSIMGHGPYDGEAGRTPNFVSHEFLTGTELQASIDKYCSITAETCAALSDLIKRLEERARPYFLVIMGDHAPSFAADFDALGVWQKILSATGTNEPVEQILYKTPLFLLTNYRSAQLGPIESTSSFSLGAEVLGRMGFSDPLVFGPLSATTLGPTHTAAYAYDTLYGSQEVTRPFIASTGCANYEVSREEYRKYKVGIERLNALGAALSANDFPRFERLYAEVGPTETIRRHADVLWGSVQLDKGNLSPSVWSAFQTTVDSEAPFWGHYHRIRYLGASKELERVEAEVQLALNAAPEQVHELSQLAKTALFNADAAFARAVLSPIVKSSLASEVDSATWAGLCIAMGQHDDAVLTALQKGRGRISDFWLAFHELRVHAARGEYTLAKIAARRIVTEFASPVSGIPLAVFAGASETELKERFLTSQKCDSEVANEDSRSAHGLALLGLVNALYLMQNRDLEIVVFLAESLLDLEPCRSAANLLCASAKLDLGLTGSEVEEHLSGIVGEGEIPWAWFHRARLSAAECRPDAVQANVLRAIDAGIAIEHLTGLARQLVDLGDRASAVAVLVAIRSVSPPPPDVNLLWATLQIDNGKAGHEIEVALDTSVREGEQTFWTEFQRIRHAALLGNLQAVRNATAMAYNAEPVSVARLVRLAQDYLTAQDHKTCRSILDSILSIAPQEPGANMLFAALQIGTGIVDENVRNHLLAALKTDDCFWGLYHYFRWACLRKDLETAAIVAGQLSASLGRSHLTQVDNASLEERAREASKIAALQAGLLGGDSKGTDSLGLGSQPTHSTYRGEALLGLVHQYLAIDGARPEIAMVLLEPMVFSDCPVPIACIHWASLRIDTGSTDPSVEQALEIAGRQEQSAWVDFHLARWHLLRNELTKAIQAFVKGLAKSDAQPGAFLDVAQQFLTRGELAKGQSLLNLLLQRFHEHPEINFIWATVQMDLGDCGRGVKSALDKASGLPNPFWVLRQLTRMYLLRGDTSGSRSAALRALATDSSRASSLVSLVANAGEFATEARDAVLGAVLEVAPTDPDANFHWAVSQFDLGNIDVEVERALSVARTGSYPGWAELYLARMYLDSGKLESALVAARSALTATPAIAVEIASLAKELSASGDNIAAASLLAEVIVRDPNNLGANVQWAAINIDLGKIGPEVEIVLNRSKAGDFEYWARYHLVRLAILRGDAILAAENSSAALPLAPDQAAGILQLASFAEQQGQVSVAEKIREVILEVLPQHPDANLAWATKKLESGEGGQSVKNALDIGIGVGSFWGLFHRARYYVEMGEVENICKDVAEALEIYPSAARHFIQLAKHTAELGCRPIALAILNCVLGKNSEECSAHLLWAALSIDEGRLDERVEAALNIAMKGDEKFWVHYHRVRLFAMRKDMQNLHVELEAVNLLAPERSVLIEQVLATCLSVSNSVG